MFCERMAILSDFTLNDRVVMNRETIVGFPFSVGKTQIPFVDRHIGRVQFAKAAR
jgi:hypothetical protein